MKLIPFEYAVRNLGRSRARLLLSIGGSALVVLLVLAAAAFVRGMDTSLRATGHPDNVIILGTGSEESIERSEIAASIGSLVTATIPGIRARAGQAYVSPEVHVQLPVKLDPAQDRGPTILIRGVTPAAALVHSQVQVVEGRFPTPGNDEILVGAMSAVKLGVGQQRLAVGGTLYLDDRPLTIVGRFVAPGTVTQAELWVPLTDLKQLTKRETDSCVVLTLDRAKSHPADVEAFAKTRFDLEITSTPEPAYYARLSSFFGPIRAVAWVTAALIGVGGLFGGLNTMYAAFASRVREVGTLQSLGFRRGAIIVSLVQESVLATGVGALIAAAVGVLLLDDLAVRFSMGAFGLRVDAAAMLTALGAGIALGLVGSLPPAIRCLRLPIPAALKSV
jgi:putative ABC transport system permease protein